MNAFRSRARRIAGTAALTVAALVVTSCSATPGPGTMSTEAEQPGAVTATAADGALVDLVPAAVTVQSVRRSKRPNIVMIMTDDMRADDLRFMPTVRRQIRERGLEFENSFSPFPLCCPARASFLTGRYAHNHHVMSHVHPYGFGAFDDSRTLATALRGGGYQTGFVGKYLNNYGLDDSLVTGGPSLRYVPAGWTDWEGTVQTAFRPRHRFAGGTYAYFKTTFNVNGKLESHKGEYQTAVIGQKARDLIGKYARSRKPFFLYVSPVAPHHGSSEADDPAPVVRDDGGTERFKTPARPAWVKGWFDQMVTRPPGLPRDGGPSEADISDKPRFLRGMPEVNDAERAALVAVTRQRAESLYVLDRQIKRIITKLKRTGEYANTVLMFTSDNGYFLGEHRVRTGKIKPHEPSLRVPFLVSGPGVPVGQKRFDPITTVDLPATIADLANVTSRMPYALDGASRLPTIRRGDRGWRTPVITEAMMVSLKTDAEAGKTFVDARDSIGIRTARYKYVRYVTGENELYDLDLDPDEMTNVYDDPAYAQVREELHAVWRKYKDCRGAACTAPLPDGLRTGPVQLRASTLRQSAIHEAVYGR